jgi:hypothetical protein
VAQNPDLTIEQILERHGAELNRETLSYLARLLARARDATPEN